MSQAILQVNTIYEMRGSFLCGLNHGYLILIFPIILAYQKYDALEVYSHRWNSSRAIECWAHNRKTLGSSPSHSENVFLDHIIPSSCRSKKLQVYEVIQDGQALKCEQTKLHDSHSVVT